MLAKPVVGLGTWALAPPGTDPAPAAADDPAAAGAPHDRAAPHDPAAAHAGNPHDPIVRVDDPAAAARTALDLIR